MRRHGVSRLVRAVRARRCVIGPGFPRASTVRELSAKGSAAWLAVVRACGQTLSVSQVSWWTPEP